MTRMTRPDCAVMCNLINTHTHTHMSRCGEAGPDIHTFVKELAIRRVEHGSEINSDESWDLAGRTEVACFRRRLSLLS